MVLINIKNLTKEALIEKYNELQAEIEGLKRAIGDLRKFANEVCDKNSQLNAEARQLQGKCVCLEENLTLVQKELLKHRWIPVGESYPPDIDGIQVLLLYKDGKIQKDTTFEGGTPIWLGLTHWKPIPEAPEAKP